MGKLTIVLLLSCALLPLGVARAQDDDDDDGADEFGEFERPGWYLGLAATYAVENFTDQTVIQSGERVPTNYRNAWGGDVRGGYRFNAVSAFEVEWEGLKAFNDRSGAGTDIEAWTATGNIKLFMPFERLQPFILGGMGMMQAETGGPGFSSITDEAFIIRGGGGLDIYITEHIVLTTDVTYTFPTEDLDGLDHVSISWGALFRF